VPVVNSEAAAALLAVSVEEDTEPGPANAGTMPVVVVGAVVVEVDMLWPTHWPPDAHVRPGLQHWPPRLAAQEV
jgi:hypothetical protein